MVSDPFCVHLKALNELAFTDKHYVWMAQHWTSEDDFFTATANYLIMKPTQRIP